MPSQANMVRQPDAIKHSVPSFHTVKIPYGSHATDYIVKVTQPLQNHYSILCLATQLVMIGLHGPTIVPLLSLAETNPWIM